MSQFTSRLHRAAAAGNIETLRHLINKGLDVNKKDFSNKHDFSGYTPLHAAIYFNLKDLNLIELLLDSGADIESRSSNGRTPLHVAAEKSDTTIAEYLLSRGADPNSADCTGYKPINFALAWKNFDLLKTLIKAGAYVNAKNNLTAALIGAIEANNADLTECFLSLGADPTDKRFKKLLHYAIPSKPVDGLYNHKIIKMLLNYGADANALDSGGRTPLLSMIYFIMGKGNSLDLELKKKLVFLLLQHSDVNILNPKGIDILTIAKKPFLEKLILEHVGKLKALGLPIHQRILDTIYSDKDYKVWFQMCTEELEVAKNTKLKNSWVTFFNLLVDNNMKLKNYAGNKEIVQDFKTKKWVQKFPIYCNEMSNNMRKAIKERELFDKSGDLLHDCLVIFSPTHLVIRDILNCMMKKDLSKFCEKRYAYH